MLKIGHLNADPEQEGKAEGGLQTQLHTAGGLGQPRHCLLVRCDVSLLETAPAKQWLILIKTTV